MLETFAMPVKCSDCAYRPGTPANLSPRTQLVAELCVQTDEPFYCHANADAHGNLPHDQERLCRGYLEALAARGPMSEVKAAIAAEGMRILAEAERRLKAGEPEIPPDVVTARLIEAGERAHWNADV
jgi:hypothetical protein